MVEAAFAVKGLTDFEIVTPAPYSARSALPNDAGSVFAL